MVRPPGIFIGQRKAVPSVSDVQREGMAAVVPVVRPPPRQLAPAAAIVWILSDGKEPAFVGAGPEKNTKKRRGQKCTVFAAFFIVLAR